MSSANTTLYYTAIEDMFKDMLLDASAEEHMEVVESKQPLTITPKRQVRIRKLNLFAKDSRKDYITCRRMPMPMPMPLPVPSTKRQCPIPVGSVEMRRELQTNELVQLRRQLYEAERNKPNRHQTMRI